LHATPAATAAAPHVKVGGLHRHKLSRNEERHDLSALSSAAADAAEDSEKDAVEDTNHAAVDEAEADEGALGKLLSPAMGVVPGRELTVRSGSTYLSTSPARDSKKRGRGTMHSSGSSWKRTRK
jgi:hypothetical protein